jgi:hypothetical protein
LGNKDVVSSTGTAASVFEFGWFFAAAVMASSTTVSNAGPPVVEFDRLKDSRRPCFLLRRTKRRHLVMVNSTNRVLALRSIF